MRALLDKYSSAWVFAVVVSSGLLLTILTDHVWEDYYITYRSSKNLATGHGLVFNPGERVHTFTSPLGVLLPAVASLAVRNHSDLAALWLFRLASIGALGLAAVLVHRNVRQIHGGATLAVLCAVAFAGDIKSVDFSINGMETGFMLLFLAYALWSLSPGLTTRRWLHIGLAWAGLMWTRPDSFIYIGLLALAALLFSDRSRSDLLRELVFAGLVCTIAYLPWFIFAWAYYGSPIPHTIVAKASVSPTLHSPLELLKSMAKIPLSAWKGATTLEATFLPSYYMTGDWPKSVVWLARAIGFLTAFLWLVPKARSEVRLCSFSFLGAHCYLTSFPYFPFPWYIPPTTLLAFSALLALLAQWLRFKSADDRRWPGNAMVILPLGLAALALGVQLWLYVVAGRQIRAMQEVVETSNRREVGEWLARHAAHTDRIFLEPLGYVGFFSNLKTYDWPGLSSPEVVEAHRKVGPNWGSIILELRPEWILLRPPETKLIEAHTPEVLGKIYSLVRTFDVRDRVNALSIRGRKLLELDAYYLLYRRHSDVPRFMEIKEQGSRYPGLAMTMWGENSVGMVHAPGWLRFDIPPGSGHMSVLFGLLPGSYEADPKTDGVTFEIAVVVNGQEHILLTRHLDPAQRPEDRELNFFASDIPAEAIGTGELILRTLSGQTDTKDWSVWSAPGFW